MKKHFAALLFVFALANCTFAQPVIRGVLSTNGALQLVIAGALTNSDTRAVSFQNTITGNGIGLTNVLEKNVAIATNTWGNAVVNFTLGTQVGTNMAGAALTITGITGFNPTNLNFQEIDINPNTFDTVITVPAAWYVSGFTNGLSVTVPLTNWGKLRIEAVIGRSTNASLEIFL